MKKLICVFLMFALGCSLLAGCTAKSTAVNLMADISAKAAEPEEISLYQYGRELNEFALKLFDECRIADKNKKNTLISPLSVVLALSMTANGADGETLSQMENTLGLSKNELNRFAYLY